jgi:hypothetical protein
MLPNMKPFDSNKSGDNGQNLDVHYEVNNSSNLEANCIEIILKDPNKSQDS